MKPGFKDKIQKVKKIILKAISRFMFFKMKQSGFSSEAVYIMSFEKLDSSQRLACQSTKTVETNLNLSLHMLCLCA